MSDNLVIVENISEGVTLLTLNRPDKKNALSVALRDAVSDAFDKIAADGKSKVVILTGAGNTFSAGFDLKEFERAFAEPAFSKELWDSSDRYHRLILEFPLPTIAAVNGAALAGGFDTAVLCDIRIAADTARFAHPEIAFGDVVYGPLHDLVGGAVARDLCLTGRAVSAEEALRLNLVSEVVPAANLRDRAIAVAQKMAQSPRDILLRTKAKFVARAKIAFTKTLEL